MKRSYVDIAVAAIVGLIGGVTAGGFLKLPCAHWCSGSA